MCQSATLFQNLQLRKKEPAAGIQVGVTGVIDIAVPVRMEVPAGEPTAQMQTDQATAAEIAEILARNNLRPKNASPVALALQKALEKQ